VGRQDRHISPALYLLLATGAVFVAALALSKVKAKPGTTGTVFISSPNFRVWIAVAAFSAALWLILFIRGCRLLTRLDPKGDLAIDILLYVLFAVAIVLALWVLQGRALAVPIVRWAWRTRALLALAGLAAAPWMMAVWRIHKSLHQLGPRMEAVRTASADTSAETKSLMQQLSATWEDIQHVILALSLVVTPAVLTTGALRLALVPDYVSSKEFPKLSVMLYGLFFAVFVAAAVLPMVLAYRSRARELVDYLEPVPAGGKPTSDFTASRERLEGLLHLDIGYLQSPITVLSILAPFVTAAVTALIPTGK
jgi:hypothetical protein